MLDELHHRVGPMAPVSFCAPALQRYERNDCYHYPHEALRMRHMLQKRGFCGQLFSAILSPAEGKPYVLAAVASPHMNCVHIGVEKIW